MLALALESLDRAKNCPNDVRIFADYGANLDEIEYSRDTYLPTAEIFSAGPHISAPSGTWNILNSIRAAFETEAQLIFHIEEDVRVFPGYFTWAFEQMATGRYAAVCGRQTAWSHRFLNMYSNPGSCLSRSVVEQLIPHINDDYFIKLRGYLDEHFVSLPEHSDLDDGLIRRVILKMGGICGYPATPKVAHQGFKFYNVAEQYKNPGDIKQRIQGLRLMLKKMKQTDRYARDFEPYIV